MNSLLSFGIVVDGIPSNPYSGDGRRLALTIQPLINLKFDHECRTLGACAGFPRYPGLVWSSVMAGDR